LNAELAAALTQWNWQPPLILGTIAILELYLYATGPLRVKYTLRPAVPLARTLSFIIGVNLIFLTLFSPLDAIGDRYLFAAHMLQHLLLALFAPPLLIIGMPSWLLRPLLRHRTVLTLGKALTHPAVAASLFTVNLWLWHAPPLFDATLVNLPLHEFCHLLYIGTGILFWWPIFSPLHEGWRPLPLGGKLAYLFFSDMPMVLLGAGLTFSPPFYTRYQYAPRLFGVSPAVDQQLGGLLMWIVGSLFLIVVASALFLRWMLQQERRERLAETDSGAE
jgi:cytochrome c oxidase assembly factor CtaG